MAVILFLVAYVVLTVLGVGQGKITIGLQGITAESTASVPTADHGARSALDDFTRQLGELRLSHERVIATSGRVGALVEVAAARIEQLDLRIRGLEATAAALPPDRFEGHQTPGEAINADT